MHNETLVLGCLELFALRRGHLVGLPPYLYDMFT